MKKVWVYAAGIMMGVTGVCATSLSQTAPAGTPPAQQQPKKPTPPTTDESGPTTGNDGIVLKKKNTEEAPAAAPAEEKVKNPNNETFSMRVDVPIVNLDVNVLLDKTHQFVPGLQAGNFVVTEDGVEQPVTSLRVTKTPITAVMLLEFAANSYWLINDMRNSAVAFYRTLQPDDYIAVSTYDLRTHILCDFTNNKGIIAQSLQSLMIPGFSETNEFDALYEMLDRLSRVEGRKYIILISSGRDTMSRITLDQMLQKIKQTPDVTIFTVSTGGLLREMSDNGVGMSSGIRHMDNLQADNEMRTFAQMTGGMWFNPVFQGALGDVFSQINESIRNQYVVTYRPTNGKNDGSYRKVKVYLVDKEGKPLKMQDEKGKQLKYSVITRDGYRAKLPVE